MPATPRPFNGQQWLTAKFTTYCAWCDTMIRPGDIFKYDDDNLTVGQACCSPPADTPPHPPACTKCFQIPAANGACGCWE